MNAVLSVSSPLPASAYVDTVAVDDAQRSGGPAFTWPTPPLARYPMARPLLQAEPCELELAPGHIETGLLTRFEPVGQWIGFQPRDGSDMRELSFAEFRLLRLISPLRPDMGSVGTQDQELLADRPALSYHLEPSQDGHAIDGLTLGHVQTDYGVFLFEPLDLKGGVRRIFVPRLAYRQFRLGRLTGETLIDEHLVSSGQVDEALGAQRQLREKRLGEILVARRIVSTEQLGEAIEAQGRMPMVRIGEALTTLGFITNEQLGKALAQQQTDRSIPLGELLVRMGRLSRQDLQTALVRKMGYPLVDVLRFEVEPEATRRLPFTIA
ncbi:MAG: hypothetical protein RL722_935, partial [Pseudomonadota bacterium]